MAVNTEKTGENLLIWDKVKDTAKEALSGMNLFTSNGTELTAINHNYQIKRATELFGPCGLGWGYEIVKAEFINATDVIKISSVHINFWYKHNGTTYTYPHFGQTTFVSQSVTSELIVDDDAHKKSLTSAINKALSMLGFSADVYGQAAQNAPTMAQAEQAVQEELEDEKLVKLNACKTLLELGDFWVSLLPEDMKKYVDHKNAKKKQLEAAA